MAEVDADREHADWRDHLAALAEVIVPDEVGRPRRGGR
jgi:hypothetical protein